MLRFHKFTIGAMPRAVHCCCCGSALGLVKVAVLLPWALALVSTVLLLLSQSTYQKHPPTHPALPPPPPAQATPGSPTTATPTRPRTLPTSCATGGAGGGGRDGAVCVSNPRRCCGTALGSLLPVLSQAPAQPMPATLVSIPLPCSPIHNVALPADGGQYPVRAVGRAGGLPAAAPANHCVADTAGCYVGRLHGEEVPAPPPRRPT